MKPKNITKLEELANLVGELSSLSSNLLSKWIDYNKSSIDKKMNEYYPFQMSFDDLVPRITEWKEHLDSEIFSLKLKREKKVKSKRFIETKIEDALSKNSKKQIKKDGILTYWQVYDIIHKAETLLKECFNFTIFNVESIEIVDTKLIVWITVNEDETPGIEFVYDINSDYVQLIKGEVPKNVFDKYIVWQNC